VRATPDNQEHCQWSYGKLNAAGAFIEVLYDLHEFHRAMLGPAAGLARAGAEAFSSSGTWLSHVPGASGVAAMCELAYRLGKRYEKPTFGIDSVEVGDASRVVGVREETVLTKPFCRLLRFRRLTDRPEIAAELARQPTVLLVAPLSGHHATLLRDTVRSLLTSHHVYVTDWTDARLVPCAQGAFALSDYVEYLLAFMRHLGTDQLHVVAVCQAVVPAVAAAALAASGQEPQPRSLTLLGGPVDTRRNPTSVNELATKRSLRWFETHLLQTVPGTYPGRGRRVYPGFLQHASFVAMNPLRHAQAHSDFLHQLLRGDSDGAEHHRRFYDEYNAVLDMAGEYYLDCVRVVFQEHLLPRGAWHLRGERVAPELVTETALFTIEGQNDDITGPGQTQAAHDLFRGIPADRRAHLTVPGAGHYGIFSGRAWREVVFDRLRAFIAAASS
jgi:poly(3-hydroxybutyrate) depolymerase